MKYIIIALLLLVPIVGSSQVRIEALQLNDSVATGATYAASQEDTSIAYDMRSYDAAWVEFSASDSVEVYLYYMPSKDGSTFRARIAVDSMISIVAAGNHVSFPIPAKAMGEHRVKFGVHFEAIGQGVTTPKYTARLIRKKY
jgi:hypothetical protein